MKLVGPSVCMLVALLQVNAKTTSANYGAPRQFNERSRDHLNEAFRLGEPYDVGITFKQIIHEMESIYHRSIKPFKDAYKFQETDHFSLTEGDISALPRILLMGPWSTGKTAMINYLLDIETSPYALPSGAPPTTTDFTILQFGEEFKKTDGEVLAMESTFTPLKKFGHDFLKNIKALKIPCKLLKKVTLIDTPGIIENQKQKHRGYEFEEVCKWFLDHSDIILVVFDPSKLDVGVELEKLFRQIKGHESKVRFVLNKADTVTTQEMLQVYGALFWNLAPLIKVSEPPRVYIGSFWSQAYSSQFTINHEYFQDEEVRLLKDLYIEIDNWMEKKLVSFRQHAIYVRNHALTVDQFSRTAKKHASMIFNNDEKVQHIVANPEIYSIPNALKMKYEISEHDLLNLQYYQEFFKKYPLDTFKLVESYCGYFSACLLDNINTAIDKELPDLLLKLEVSRMVISKVKQQQYCSEEEAKSEEYCSSTFM